MNYIYAIKIYLDGVYSTDDDLGIYTVSGKSYIKWSELPIYGASVTGTWKSGILSGLSPISYTADCQNKGAVVSAGAYTVDAFNTDQLSLKLYELGIHLNGLKCERVLFVGTDSDSDSVSSATVHTGLIDLSNGMQWSETDLSFAVKTGMHKRNANITEKADIENGDIIPVTFGASSPVDGLYFKASRTISDITILNQSDIATGGIIGTDIIPGNMALFPVSDPVGTAPTLVYDIRLGYIDSSYLPDDSFFVGKYILVTEGKGEGVYRLIDDADITYTGETVLQITVQDYFTDDLVGNFAGTETDQTWVQLVEMEREYRLDNERCVGFFSETGGLLVNAVELYGLSGDDVVRIPPYGYDVDITKTDLNSIEIDPKLFNKTPDDMLSFYISPVTNFGLYDEDDMADWATDIEPWWAYITKIQDGIYASIEPDELTDVAVTGTVANVIDKDPDTFYELKYHVKQNSSAAIFYKVFKFKLPPWPETLSVNKVYLGIKLWSQCYCAEYENPGAVIMTRGYIGRRESILEGKKYAERYSLGAEIINIPDFYWIPAETTGNLDFYRDAQPDGSSNYIKISGYNTIDFNVTTKEEYEAIYECVIVLHRLLGYGGEYDDTTRIYQIAVMFETEAEIKKEIYV